MSDHKRFALTPDEDGYPPISVESMNAVEVEEGRFRLRNAPFFVSGIAYDDLVEARQSPDGGYDFVRCIEPSDFRCLSIILLSESLGGALMDLLRGRDAVIEYGEFGALRMVAVAVPAEVDYQEIKRNLDRYEAEGLISYAELAV